jgi:hypothetical protein
MLKYMVRKVCHPKQRGEAGTDEAACGVQAASDWDTAFRGRDEHKTRKRELDGVLGFW